jgi:neutral ceramidase
MKAWQIIATAVALGSLASARGPQPGSPAPAAGLVPVGVARIDITPDEPIRLTGYGNRTAPSDGVEGRLWAKALAFGGDADTPSVLITADLIGVSRAMSDEVAGRLTGAGLDRAHVAIAATHTHTGPSLTGVLPFIFSTPPTPGEQAVIDRYTRQLVDRLERVARDALADRRPARLAWGQGRAGFAANRRVLKDGKWIGFGVTPSGAVDHDLPVLTVSSPDGRSARSSPATPATRRRSRESTTSSTATGRAWRRRSSRSSTRARSRW